MTASRIDWVAEHCVLLRSIAEEFRLTQQFRGLTIGTGIHLEAKTVSLIRTLVEGGARVLGLEAQAVGRPSHPDRRTGRTALLARRRRDGSG